MPSQASRQASGEPGTVLRRVAGIGNGQQRNIDRQEGSRFIEPRHLGCSLVCRQATLTLPQRPITIPATEPEIAIMEWYPSPHEQRCLNTYLNPSFGQGRSNNPKGG